MTDDPTGPRYRFAREMLREELRTAARGERTCLVCDRTASLMIRRPISEDQCRRLGTDALGTTTYAFLYLCPTCLRLPDLGGRLDRAVEDGVADGSRPLYDLGGLEPPGGR